MVICSVPLCSSRSDRGQNINEDGTKISFHEFPREPTRRTKWIQAISRQGKNNTMWQPVDKSDRSVVCSNHFTTEDYKEGKKMRFLKSTAVPSVFKEFPAHKQKHCPKRRASKKSNEHVASLSQASDEIPSNLMLLASVCNEQERVDNTAEIGVNTKLTYSRLSRKRNKHKNLLLKFWRLKKVIAKKNTLIQELKKENREMKKKLTDLNIYKLEASNTKKKEILIEQLKCFEKKKPRWCDTTIRFAILLHAKSPRAYNFIRKKNMFSLPSKSTLRRYIGPTSGMTVSSLIKQRLVNEAKKLTRDVEFFGSLIIDEMSIKPCVQYNKQSDEIVGIVTTMKDISNLGIEEKIANKLLCFVFTGLSTHFKLPVSYYFTKGLSGEELFTLVLNVLKNVEEVGFKVVRIVTDNHITNVKMFAILSNDIIPKPVITHPLDPNRQLFLSFDPCHILKNFRNIFFARNLMNKGETISSDYIKLLYKMQKGNIIKPVRNLTYKHVYPSNFDKMNVGRAMTIFSPEVVTALKFLRQNAQRLGKVSFINATATIQYLEMVQKWFAILNVKNRYHHLTSRNPDVMHFVSVNDERLNWLINIFLPYLEEWKNSCSDPGQFLSIETYRAVKLTTESTVKCIKFLLDSKFHYVLTRKLNSDEIESFFSALRQMSGSNDMTNANNCVQNIHKILITGIVSSSSSSNVGPSLNEEWMTNLNAVRTSNGCDLSLPIEATSTFKDLEVPPVGFPVVSAESAAMAYVGGYIVYAVEKEISCQQCLDMISTPRCPSPLMGLIDIADRGALKYPKPSFVMLLLKIEKILKSILSKAENVSKLSMKLRKIILPHLSINPLLTCNVPCQPSHSQKLSNIILKSFIRPYLTNYTKNLTETYTQNRMLRLKKKPLSRKVLKVSLT